MIFDSINNLEKYVAVEPKLQHVVDFVRKHDLQSFAPGRVDIAEGVFANFQVAEAKTRETAVLESHNRMLDVQINLGEDEEIGWCSRAGLPQMEYNEEGDYTLYPCSMPSVYHTIRQGEFVIYFPQDCHAPNITCEKKHRKVVFKVSV